MTEDAEGLVSLPLLNLLWDPDHVSIALCGSTIVVRSGPFCVMSVFNCFESLGVPGGESE